MDKGMDKGMDKVSGWRKRRMSMLGIHIHATGHGVIVIWVHGPGFKSYSYRTDGPRRVSMASVRRMQRAQLLLITGGKG